MATSTAKGIPLFAKIVIFENIQEFKDSQTHLVTTVVTSIDCTGMAANPGLLCFSTVRKMY